MSSKILDCTIYQDSKYSCLRLELRGGGGEEEDKEKKCRRGAAVDKKKNKKVVIVVVINGTRSSVPKGSGEHECQHHISCGSLYSITRLRF